MKVLVLSCSTGEGHNSAGRSIYEEFLKQKIPCEFKDAFSFGKKFITTIIKNSFNTIAVKTPKLFGEMYKAGSFVSSKTTKSIIYYANIMYAEKLGNYINNKKIDVVVCSHLFPMEALSYLINNKKIRANCYGVSTDYTCIPFLEETNLKAIFVPHKSLIKEFVKKGIKKSNLIVTGIPVADKFKTKLEKTTARQILKLSINKKIFLVMTGGVGCGNVTSICNNLLKYGDKDILIIVLVGKNNDLYHELKEKYQKEKRIKAITFTKKVQIYMDASDVLLTKPGGLSSTEAAVKNIPIVHTNPIPGCESKNAEFFSQNGLSLVAKDMNELVINAYKLLNDRELKKTLLDNQQLIINNDANKDIVRYIINDN